MHYWIELKTDMYEGLLFYFKIMEYITFSSPKAQGLLRKRGQNYCKARGNENTETTFAEPDRAFPHMNSQWLGLHAQKRAQDQLSQSPNMLEGGACLSPAEELLVVDDCWGRDTTPRGRPSSFRWFDIMYIQAKLSGLSRCIKRVHEVGRGKGWVGFL